MTLSEVFYEAACGISNGDMLLPGTGDIVKYSCHAVALVATGGKSLFGTTRLCYGDLMTHDTQQVTDTAAALAWSVNDFRTFMLLMASEAVK